MRLTCAFPVPGLPRDLLVKAALLLALATPAAAYDTPQRGTDLRRDLMNAIRPLAEANFGDPVIFVVSDLRHARGKAFGVLQPQRPDGRAIMWHETAMAAQGDSPDFYDGLTLHVFYRRHGRNWSVADWSIGATDVWWHGSILCVEFGAVIPEAC